MHWAADAVGTALSVYVLHGQVQMIQEYCCLLVVLQAVGAAGTRCSFEGLNYLHAVLHVTRLQCTADCVVLQVLQDILQVLYMYCTACTCVTLRCRLICRHCMQLNAYCRYAVECMLQICSWMCCRFTADDTVLQMVLQMFCRCAADVHCRCCRCVVCCIITIECCRH